MIVLVGSRKGSFFFVVRYSMRKKKWCSLIEKMNISDGRNSSFYSPHHESVGAKFILLFLSSFFFILMLDERDKVIGVVLMERKNIMYICEGNKYGFLVMVKKPNLFFTVNVFILYFYSFIWNPKYI